MRWGGYSGVGRNRYSITDLGLGVFVDVGNRSGLFACV